MTDNELLAIFAGWEYEDNWMKRGDIIMPCYDWNPATDPRQWYSVLEALVTKVVDSATLDVTHTKTGVRYKLYSDCNQGPQFDVSGEDFPQAVCDAAMEVIESEGK